MQPPQPPPMKPAVRTLNYWLSVVLLALTTALIVEGIFALPLILGWLIGVNVFSFVYYGIDKLNSIWEDDVEAHKAKKTRIPEAALLLMAAAGGSLGAASAMIVFSHKTNKEWFLIRFAGLVVLQAALVFFLWDSLPWA